MENKVTKVIKSYRGQKYQLVSLLNKGFNQNIYQSRIYTIIEIQLKNYEEKYTKFLLKQIQIIKQIKHQNIVQIYDHFKEDQFYYIVIGANCKNTFKKYFKGKRCQQNSILIKIKQLVQTNKKLSEKGSTKRNFNPSNIFMFEKKYQTILADFDLTKFDYQNKQKITQIPLDDSIYLSPELLRGNQYSQKSAVWCLGIILYETLCNKLPWTPQENKLISKNMIKKQLKFNSVCVSDPTKNLLNKMLQPQEQKRIGMYQLEKEITLILNKNCQNRERGKSLTIIKRVTVIEDSLQKYEKKNIIQIKKQQKVPIVLKSQKTIIIPKNYIQPSHSCSRVSRPPTPVPVLINNKKLKQDQKKNQMKISFGPEAFSQKIKIISNQQKQQTKQITKIKNGQMKSEAKNYLKQNYNNIYHGKNIETKKTKEQTKRTSKINLSKNLKQSDRRFRDKGIQKHSDMDIQNYREKIQNKKMMIKIQQQQTNFKVEKRENPQKEMQQNFLEKDHKINIYRQPQRRQQIPEKIQELMQNRNDIIKKQQKNRISQQKLKLRIKYKNISKFICYNLLEQEQFKPMISTNRNDLTNQKQRWDFLQIVFKFYRQFDKNIIQRLSLLNQKK